jgi:hypothetical protein
MPAESDVPVKMAPKTAEKPVKAALEAAKQAP